MPITGKVVITGKRINKNKIIVSKIIRIFNMTDESGNLMLILKKEKKKNNWFAGKRDSLIVIMIKNIINY